MKNKYFGKRVLHPLNTLMLTFLLCMAGQSKGQTAASYVFSTSNGTYTPITGGTLLSSGAGMDDAMFSVTIPSFTYLGVAYTQVYADENGYIQFGATSPTTTMRSYLSSTEAAARTGVSAYSRDLAGKSTTSQLRTQTIGSEVIFQWTNMANFASTAQTIAFQIRLNTTTNVINVVYNMNATTATTAQVGLRGSTTDFNNRSSTTSWTASTAGAANTATVTLSATVFPVAGQTYTWSPPLPCSGKPTGGTAISSTGAALLCPGSAAALSVSGSTVATGIVYAWDSSIVSSTGPWSAISGAAGSGFSASPAACSNVFYRRRTICTTSGLFDSSTAVKVSVKCAAPPPYFEDFESITAANTFPNCMTATNVGTLVNTMIGSGDHNRFNHTPLGSKYAYFRYGCNDFIFTPPIILTAGKTYEFSFWYVNDGTAFDSLTLSYGNAPSAAAMVNKLPGVGAIIDKTYTRYKTRFVASASGIQYFGINCKSTFAPWYLCIDDLALQEVPLCSGAPVTGLPNATPGRICGAGATALDLPSIAPALGLTYIWQDSTSGSSWGNDASRPSFGGTTLPFTSGIISTNTYFRCIVKCSLTGDSTITAPVLVNAGPYSIPYIQTFESISADNELPQCMSATSLNPYVHTFTTPMANNRKNNTPGGAKYASFHWSADDYLFSPPINFVSGYQYILSFSYITDGLNGWNTLRANLGSSPTAAGMTKSLKTISSPKNTTYVQYTDTFTMPASGVYHFGIYCNANAVPFYLSIDDINLQYRPCFGSPAGGSINGPFASGTGVCPNTKIRLSSVGATPDFIPGIVYQWQRKSITTSGATWVNVAGANSPVLEADTLGGYEYRLAIVCTVTNDTTFSSTYMLPQLPLHPPVSITPSTSPITYCLGDTVKLMATNFSGAVYDWMKDSTIVPGWKFSDIGVTEPGSYWVRVSSGISPCPAYSNVVKININDPGYSVNLTTPSDSIICDGKSVLLTGTASKAGVSYRWRKNNVYISGATGNTYLAGTSGYYSLTASDGISTCVAVSRSIKIVVNPNPPANITLPGGTATGCEVPGVKLSANPVASYSYEWLRGGLTMVGTTDSFLYAVSSGSYQVKVRTPSGCVSVSAPVVVTILPSPIPILKKTGLVLGLTLPYTSYQWLRNGAVMSGRTSDTLQLSLKGTYKVRVTDANGCAGESNSIDVNDVGLGINTATLSEETIKVYPNPTNGKVFIESPVALTIEVKDMTGKIIFTDRGAKDIDLSNYANGIYLIVLRNEDQFIKQVRISKMSR